VKRDEGATTRNEALHLSPKIGLEEVSKKGRM